MVRVLILLLMLVLRTTAGAQADADIQFAQTLPELPENHHVNLVSTDSVQGSGMLVFRVPYYLYKQFVSSQDAQQCSFHPSCANYALLAVNKYGVLKGMLAGFDRLTRCHGRDHLHYIKHYPSRRWLDEP